MDSKQRQNEILTKAKEAKPRADQTRDRHQRESWLQTQRATATLRLPGAQGRGPRALEIVGAG